VIVLGMDTATAATSVALRLADGTVSEVRDDPRPGEHPGHATRLLEMAHQLLSCSGVGWGDVQRIAVGVGPGTFTGLRVGVATARGLAQSLSAELVGVSSLQALAAAALAEPAVEGRPDAILAAIDARRGEVFAAAYRRGEDDAPVPLAPARALAPELMGSVVAEAQPTDDAGARSWLALGDGAIRFRHQLEEAGLAVPPDSSALHLLGAAAVCRLGAASTPAATLEQVLPDYRRRPDAELALEAAPTGRAPQP
jgi:tRNA threonylcarbamoyladenosine biosynthesis protein TsaB